MTEAVEKTADSAALDAMNATLRRMHKTPPAPHKPAKGKKERARKSIETSSRIQEPREV